MKTLLSLLERFSQSLNKDTFTKETIIRIIQERTRVAIPLEKLSLKNGVLEISASPTAKNEISLKESIICDELGAQKIFVSRILYK